MFLRSREFMISEKVNHPDNLFSFFAYGRNHCAVRWRCDDDDVIIICLSGGIVVGYRFCLFTHLGDAELATEEADDIILGRRHRTP